MEKQVLTPGKPLKGEVRLPGDKSITHRAIIFASLAEGESTLVDPLDSEDTQATVKFLQALGVRIDQSDPQKWFVRSPGLNKFEAPEKELDAGNSGTTCRLMLGILAAQKFKSRIVADPSLSKRPMNRVLIPLQRMGARFESDNGHLPITVLPAPEKGLHPIHYESPIASAQVKSACLLAGLYTEGVMTISEPEISRDHTERMLSAFIPVNARMVSEQSSLVKAHRVHKIEFAGPVTSLPPTQFIIPRDFSSGAFFLAGGCQIPNSKISLPDVGINPTRLGFWNLLQKMKAKVQKKNEKQLQGEPVADLSATYHKIHSVHVSGETTVRAIDEIPIWCVLAAQADKISVLSDAQELRVKESDRLESMAENLKRLGVRVESKNDGLVIEGKQGGLEHPKYSGYGPGYLESYGDHRVAMALAIASLCIRQKKEGVEIHDTQCVATSFPEFFSLLKQIQ